MTHAGQSSRTKRLQERKRRQDAEFREAVDDLIWGQYARTHAHETPAWVRPAILLGGLAVSVAWIGAIAHGCS